MRAQILLFAPGTALPTHCACSGTTPTGTETKTVVSKSFGVGVKSMRSELRPASESILLPFQPSEVFEPQFPHLTNGSKNSVGFAELPCSSAGHRCGGAPATSFVHPQDAGDVTWSLLGLLQLASARGLIPNSSNCSR